MLKKWLILLLGLFVLYDTFRSFNQHYHMPLGGDIAAIVLPEDVFKPAMNDPFGLQAAFHKKHYHATNRAFAHWTTYLYFRSVPFLFQFFFTPIDSVYLSAALAKILLQLLIAYMLVRYAKPYSQKFSDIVVGLAILLPLFQTGGYNSQIGIIDQSIVYSFFYALPFALLLVFFYPFYSYFVFGEALQFSKFQHVLWVLLLVLLSFNGPLVAAVVLTGIFCLLGLRLVERLWLGKGRSLTKEMWFYISFSAALSFYSLYVGTFNSENFSTELPILIRYSKLLMGLQEVFLGSLALPLLIIFTSVNLILLNNKKDGSKVQQLVLPILVFCIMYVLLLPIGGYRIYRPNVLRNDTALPILLCVFCLFLFSTRAVLALPFKSKAVYVTFLLALLFVYHFEDGHISSRNSSERRALLQIKNAKEHTVLIQDYCTILSFKPISDSLESSVNTKMLQVWGVLEESKLYYQKY